PGAAQEAGADGGHRRGPHQDAGLAGQRLPPWPASRSPPCREDRCAVASSGRRTGALMAKLDTIAAEAVDLARVAAVEEGGEDAVGEHLGVTAEAGERVVTHSFASTVPGYRDWRWAVTLVRAARAKSATV